MRVLDIAEIAHEVNRAYCEAAGEEPPPHWGQAPQWQRDSALSGVQSYLQNDGLSPRDMHECWRSYREHEGWVYGDLEDFSCRRHPNMLRYDDLPQEQKVKDRLFYAVAKSLRRFLD